MINFDIKKIYGSKFVSVELSHYGTKIDLNLLDEEEMQELIEDLNTAAEELKYQISKIQRGKING